MGVPGFFLWLIKKYKNNNLIIKQNNNNTDYLLIDANSLIHPICMKVVSQHFTSNTTELENNMLYSIIEYITTLIELVNPQKGTYIAIDGVAPIAKVKQQRIRRYKSIHDKKLWDNIKKKYNEPIEPYWNNSAITPGTQFMVKLHNYILNWMKSTKYKIIYSSCFTPNEGEHKLLQYMKTNYNNRYVIYGLDADLIFLSLSSNVNNIFLLREGKEFNKNDTDYNYVNIDVLKTLISTTIKEYISKNNNLINIDKINNDNLINDFIFMCYFLGNDFLPHIYALDIYNNGIEQLIINYTKTLQHIFLENNDVQYLVNDSNINITFLQEFIKNLSNTEEETLKSHYYNIKKKFNIEGSPYQREMLRIENILFKVNDPVKLGYDNLLESRKRYYKYYWNIDDNEIDVFSKKLVKHYLIGLKWVTNYYFDKCNSWDWYYPFDYPPFLTDIYNHINSININTISFNIGKPLKPFVQLLCVLPPQSNFLLPDTLKLIPITNSDIIYLYPTDFEIDLINKKKYWMGIPLLPQLDINAVKNTFKKYKKKLTKEERNMNKTLDLFCN
jgi:5'-3' exonuclease